MAGCERGLERALLSDDLLTRVRLALALPAPDTAYASGLYIAETARGLAPGGLLLECRGDTVAAARSLSGGLGLIAVPVSGLPGGFRLVDKEGGGRDITLRPLAGAIHDSLEDSGFTIEAVAIDLFPAPGAGILDPLGGLADLLDGRLRTSHPRALIDDPARVLGAAELCNRFDLVPETETRVSLRSAAGLVAQLSPARAWACLSRILSGGGIGAAARFLKEFAVLEVVLPELEAIYDVPQNYYHHLGVWDHTLLTLDLLEEMMRAPAAYFPPYGSRITAHLAGELEGGLPRRCFLGLVALIHDAGKAHTMSVEPNGRIRFQGHALEGARLAAGVAARLGLGRRGSRYLIDVVRDHMRLGVLLKEGESVRTRLGAVRDLGGHTIEVIMLSLADRLATRGEASAEEGLARFRRTASRVMSDYFWERYSPALLDGRDVMVHSRVGPGPGVADALFRVRVAQREAQIGSRDQALEFIAPDFKGRM
ncbi:MAG: HD domain-containing protein [Actinobacteria bacterium]|nr:HD domain-containing protein [Actinomycetota bacterium]MBU1942735.1 HD domain-containing protein [Actinomycetota bacterium]MBU2686057.1 HD domain-containing protein [Actinomycetota bacterium]